MKINIFFALTSMITATKLEKFDEQRNLQEDIDVCVAECEEPLRDALITQYNELDEDAKTKLNILSSLTEEEIHETETLLLIYDLYDNNAASCNEDVNQDLHRILTCKHACSGKESCDEVEETEDDTFVEVLVYFYCPDPISVCDGLEIVVEEINEVDEEIGGVDEETNGGFEKVLGLFAVLTRNQ
eukprot:snap_masked-scaffold_10-processed-gene-4.32-mRNA-1 protein AED:1.00 eAED:1.00 QI:0/0/0/0/1/1/2/0/185